MSIELILFLCIAAVIGSIAFGGMFATLTATAAAWVVHVVPLQRPGGKEWGAPATSITAGSATANGGAMRRGVDQQRRGMRSLSTQTWCQPPSRRRSDPPVDDEPMRLLLCRRRAGRRDITHRQGTEGALFFSSTPRNQMSGGSFVEGDSYDSTIEEIEAMGGDPFFLDEYYAADDDVGRGDDRSESSPDNSSDWEVEDVNEGWDGVVDDNAHFDFD